MNYVGHFEDNEGNVYHPTTVKRIAKGVEFKTGRIIDGKVEYGKRFKQQLLNSPGTTTIDTELNDVEFTDFNILINTGGWGYVPVSSKVNDYSIIAQISKYNIDIITYLENYKTYYAIVEVHYLKE